jgi:ABC-type nitrate/sulfonate/bicarbonate transport system substrate-binding protein
MKLFPKWWQIVATLTLLFVLAACGGGSDQATEPTGDELPVIKIQGMEGGTSSVAAIIIEQQGFDVANGFKAEPLMVGGDASSQSMLQRNSDVNFDCDPMTAALLRSQGHEISAFYAMLAQDAYMLVRGDSPYQKPEDLIGEVVGHDGLESGTMTAANIMLDMFNDIQIEEDYVLQLTEEAALLRLLARGDLEAIFMGQPETIISEVEFGTRTIWGPAYEVFNEETGGNTWVLTMCAYEDWLLENPDLARAVMAAWDDALAWLKEDPNRLREDPFPEIFGIEDETVLDKYVDLIATTDLFTNSWTDQDVEGGLVFLEAAAEIGNIIQEVPEKSIVRLDDLVGE